MVMKRECGEQILHENRKPMLWGDYEPYDPETDSISKYKDRLRSFPSVVEVNEVQKMDFVSCK